ncbi:uridine kinase [Streptomyces sp. NPDC048650]|uniref:uridine kinase n=1 Tax=unclassified Streptomyces TaxID=2593676 RepID=UPI00371A1180
MRLEAITWERLTDALAGHLTTMTAQDGSPWLRVAIDGAPSPELSAPLGQGAPPASPAELAGELAEALRLRGRAVHKAGAFGFLRPASLRLEYGREDPDAYYDEWFDRQALWREVFQPLGPGGTGRVLGDLWDPVTDRATRSPYVRLPPGGILLLHGPLLLGHWFPFDLTVHLSLSPAALARRTPRDRRWTLPAFARYQEETRPEQAADVVVRADDPRRPAWSGLH